MTALTVEVAIEGVIIVDFGQFVGGTLLFAILIGLLALGLIIYALVDLARRPMDTTAKVLWALAILFFPFLGSVAYLIIGRSMRGTAI